MVISHYYRHSVVDILSIVNMSMDYLVNTAAVSNLLLHTHLLFYVYSLVLALFFYSVVLTQKKAASRALATQFSLN